MDDHTRRISNQRFAALGHAGLMALTVFHACVAVLTAARSLSNESNRLKVEVGKFLETVRAA